MALTPRGARRLLAGGALLVAGYYAIWGGEYSAWDLVRLRRDRAAAEAELAEARVHVDSLRGLAVRLEKQDSAVERIARERFGMIREGELLYRFVPVEQKAPARP
ncbi:MAG: septum formation initiator family protein [Gemmatimonadetes bacterium]|nr:septum formation initiator family protein [Gemmatimonadota bacterium]